MKKGLTTRQVKEKYPNARDRAVNIECSMCPRCKAVNHTLQKDIDEATKKGYAYYDFICHRCGAKLSEIANY
ncbi:MAG: hypothetical protein ACOC56_00415 [Atribacterota bacterium]